VLGGDKRGSSANGSGIADKASSQRASNATAARSERSIASKTPLITRTRFFMPIAASSPPVRSASRRAETSGRETSTRVVMDGSASAPMLAAYRSFWACNPASGPKQEVPVVLAAIKPVQAAGSLSRRRVCPVGAVSKIT
jgi:hypothetical protein